MSRSSRIFGMVLLCLAFQFVSIAPANAYIDPGAGSFIFQALVGAFLAAALTVKVFWRRIVSFVSRRPPSED